MPHVPFARLRRLFGRHSAPEETAMPAHPPASLPADPERTSAVLVDVDNVQARLAEAGRTVSWMRLKEHLRSTLGPLSLCDAFTSPRSLTKPDALWSAGFEVIACPMQYKDKDAVDAKITARATKYLYLLPGSVRVVIVSDDSDFAPLAVLAADLGKAVEIVPVERIADAIAGSDVQQKMAYSQQLRHFLTVIERFQQNGKRLNSADCRFVLDVAAAVRADVATDRGRSLHGIRQRVRELMFPRWSATHMPSNVDDVLSALKYSGAVRVRADGVRLNTQHPLWQKVP